MIDAKELRVGNFILSDNEIVKVVGIEKYNDKYSIKWWWHLGNGVYNADNDKEEDIKPIPLTPEILEQCGFEKQETLLAPVADQYVLQIDIKGSNRNEFTVMIINKGKDKGPVGNYTTNDFWSSNNFKYLHQLQNMYFSLCGEELKINLKQLV